MPRFLQTIDQCAGEILFEDPEGDRLNLKSQLCKYLFLTIRPENAQFSEGHITCGEEDARVLAEFLQKTPQESIHKSDHCETGCITSIKNSDSQSSGTQK